MKYRTPPALLTVAALVLGTPVLVADEKPTPTPTATPKTAASPAAKATRKLGGGSFGQPPATTPTAGAGGGGSLADIARKAQEDEAAAGRKPARKIVITNESLRRAEPTPAGGSISITGSAGSKPVVRVPPSPTPTVGPLPEYRDASGRTEAEWRDRAAAARERVVQAETDLVAAQEEARRLENDFYAWSDGNYRERVIRPAWDQAKERVKLMEDEVVQAREELENLSEEARKSGTPPGWLR
jgi:hypothetical protein